MELIVLGSRAGMPAPGRPSSGYLLEAGAGTLLLDCGPGVAGAVQPWLESGDLDGVVISHMHVDHCFDTMLLGRGLVGARVWGGQAAGDPIELWVPPGGAALLRRLNAVFPGGGSNDPSTYALDHVFDEAFVTREYTAGAPIEVAGFTVTPMTVTHVVPTCGFRVDHDGAVLAYSGDSGPSPTLVDLAHRADVFLCEATLQEPDSSGRGHLSAGEAGAVATEAGVGMLVLTHTLRDDEAFNGTIVAAAAAEYSGPIHVARAGDRIPVGVSAETTGEHVRH